MTSLTSESLPMGLNGFDIKENHIHKLWGIHETLDQLRGHMSRQSQNVELSANMEESGEENATLPQTYIVMRLNADVPSGVLKWLVEKIKGRRRDGGAELLVFKQPPKDDEIVLHVSASKIKFLEAAEELEIVKMDKNGQMREFTVNQLEDFLKEGMSVEDILSLAEKQTIVTHELENLRALAEDDHIPGFPGYSLYEGQSILQVCLKCKIINKVYPLHDSEALKKLGRKWYLSVFRKQPFEEIRLYFGEAIALYFTFLGFYTTALLVPVFLGFIQLLLSTETVPFFCIFNVVWVTVFLEVWKRRCNELAFKWGTIGMTSLDEPRPNFRGQMGIDAVTGRIQPQYPRWKTNAKMYCVSIPVVFVCMLGAFLVMLISFWVEDYIKQSDSSWAAHLIHLPSMLYAGLVYIMNVYYRKLATSLTEWENHRTQSQYDRHRVTKLVLFEFVNNFMSLFYIAFVIQDMDMLRNQLATMLIILQAINNLQEAVLPFILKFYITKVAQLKKFFSFTNSTFANNNERRKTFINDDLDDLLKHIPEIEDDDPRIEAAEREGDLEEYEGTYDDYLELFIQFGYVILFSSVYPIAGFWAIFNNILEIRADAFKLCMVFQRPLSRRVKDIGAWQKAFEIVGAMSIVTNCGLLCLSPQMRRKGPEVGYVEWILMFVLLEHFLLGLRYILHITIPDKPLWVRVALAKWKHESKQALKYEACERKTSLPLVVWMGHVIYSLDLLIVTSETANFRLMQSKRAQKSRRFLTRKFKTVHGSHAH